MSADGGRRLTLHHIGHATRDIAETAAVFERRFGYVAASAILHDPLQTAYVQFFSLAGEQAYLEFVAPDGPESKLTNAVKRGGRLNHLCYACDCLEETIAHLEESGMRLISAPMPGRAFGGRRICWLLGADQSPVELVERRSPDDPCTPGLSE